MSRTIQTVVITLYGWDGIVGMSQTHWQLHLSDMNLIKFSAAAIILCASFAHTQGKSFDFESRVGVVDVNERDEKCLIISNAALSKGAAITLIVLSNLQSVVHATIKEKLGQSCSYNPDTNDASFYSLQLDDKAFQMNQRQAAAIAVLTATRVVVRRAKASVDLDNDGRREFFRDCTSNEGIHLTVWTGSPLRGKRRWHFYYYLGYDVVPSCKRKDWEP